MAKVLVLALALVGLWLAAMALDEQGPPTSVAASRPATQKLMRDPWEKPRYAKSAKVP